MRGRLPSARASRRARARAAARAAARGRARVGRRSASPARSSSRAASSIVAALLVQAKTVFDNADGQLARLTGRVTAFGRYLDSECDLLVERCALRRARLVHRPAGRSRPPGFVALTAVLSVNFNVERLARGAPAAWDASVLGRVYGVLYGWQDRLAERVPARAPRRPRSTVGALAQLGMSSQLAAFGVCIARRPPARARVAPARRSSSSSLGLLLARSIESGGFA